MWEELFRHFWGVSCGRKYFLIVINYFLGYSTIKALKYNFIPPFHVLEKASSKNTLILGKVYLSDHFYSNNSPICS